MTPETVQRVFQAAESILNELTNLDRTTYKILSARISELTGLSTTVITPVLHMYVKTRTDLAVQKGRTGGIRRADSAQAIKARGVNALPKCGDCGQRINAKSNRTDSTVPLSIAEPSIAEPTAVTVEYDETI